MPHSAPRLWSSTWRSPSGAITLPFVNGALVRSSCRSNDSARASRSRLPFSRRSAVIGAGIVSVTGGSLGGRRAQRGAGDQATTTGSREHLTLRVRDLAAKERDRRPASDLPSFVRVVVACGVHLARSDRARRIRI